LAAKNWITVIENATAMNTKKMTKIKSATAINTKNKTTNNKKCHKNHNTKKKTTTLNTYMINITITYYRI